MKTIIGIGIGLRIAQDETHKDKFTREEILEKIKDGTAVVSKGSSSNFLVLTTNNNQIMGEILNIYSL